MPNGGKSGPRNNLYFRIKLKKNIPFSQPYSTCGPATFYVQPETHNHYLEIN